MNHEPPNNDLPLSYDINKPEDVINIVIDDRILSNVNYPTQNFLDFFRHHVSDILFNVLYKLPEIPKMSIFLAHAIQVLTSKNKDIRNVMTEDENLFKIILDFPKNADETSPVARGCYCKVLEQVIIMSDYDYLSKIKDGQPFLRSLLDNTYFTSVFDFLMNFVSTCVYSIILFLENNSFTDLLLEYAFAEKNREQSLRIADQLTAKLPRNLPLVKPLLDPNIMLKLLDLGFTRHSCASLEVILSVHSQPHPLSRPMINAINNEYNRICNFILNTKKFDKFGILLIYLLISIVNDIYCPIENYVQVEPVKIDYSTKKSLPKMGNKEETETENNEKNTTNPDLPKSLSKIQKEDILKKSLIIKKRTQKSRKSFRNNAKLNLDEFSLTRRSLDPSEVLHIHMQVPNINEDDEIEIENENEEDESMNCEVKKRENHSNHRRRLNQSKFHDHEDFLMRRNRRMNLIRRPASFSSKVKNEEGKFGQPIYDRTKDHDNEINRININYNSSDNLQNVINKGRLSILSEINDEDSKLVDESDLNKIDNDNRDKFGTIIKEPEKDVFVLDTITEKPDENSLDIIAEEPEDNNLDTIKEELDENQLDTIKEDPENDQNNLETISEESDENINQLPEISEEQEEEDEQHENKTHLQTISEENENQLDTITEEPEENQLDTITEEPEENQLDTITEEPEENQLDTITEEPEENQLDTITEEPEENQLEVIEEEQEENQLDTITEDPEEEEDTQPEESDENKSQTENQLQAISEENENQLDAIAEEPEENHLGTITEEPEENQLQTISEENENQLDAIAEEPEENHLGTITEEPEENQLEVIEEEQEENQLDTIAEDPEEEEDTQPEESDENKNQTENQLQAISEENEIQLNTIAEEPEENHLGTITEEPEENQLQTISEENENHLDAIAEEPAENHLGTITEEPEENHLDAITEVHEENQLQSISEDPSNLSTQQTESHNKPHNSTKNDPNSHEQKSVKINRNQYPSAIKPNLLKHHRQNSCGTPTVRDPVSSLNLSFCNEDQNNNHHFTHEANDELKHQASMPNYSGSPLTAILEDERFKPHSNILPSPSVNTEYFSLSKLPNLVQDGNNSLTDFANSAPNSTFSSPIKNNNSGKFTPSPISDFTNLRGGECPTPPAQSFSPFKETKKTSNISEVKSSTNNLNLNLNINLNQESKPLNSSQQQFYNRRHSSPYKFIPRSIPFPEKSSSSPSVSSSSSREDNQLENNDEETNEQQQQIRPPSMIIPRRLSQPTVKQQNKKNSSSDNEEEKFSFPSLNTNHISPASSFGNHGFVSNKSSLPISAGNNSNKNNIIRSELVFHPFSLLSGDRSKIRNSSPAVSFTRNTDNLQSPITTDPKTGEKLSLLDFAIQGSQHCRSKELIRPTPIQIPTNNRINANSDEIINEEIDNKIQFSVIHEIDESENHENLIKNKEEEEKIENNNNNLIQLNEDDEENENDDAENQLDKEEIIKTLVFLIDAFFENKTNSFLHNSVIQLLTSLFDYTSMTSKIITEAQLPKRILDMYSNKDKIRASFWGQLHLMAEFIKSTPEVIPDELKEKWEYYIENKYNRDEEIMENSYGNAD